MYNKIKEGYNLFIKRTEDRDLVGTLTLKEDEDNYKDINQLDYSQMQFVTQYSSINNALDENHSLFATYDREYQEFFVSIQEKSNTGKYNDIVTWNHTIVSQKKELIEAFNRLDEKVQTKLEGSYSK